MGKEKAWWLKLAIEFKKSLSRKFRISRLILFGSRARGVFGPESDFDFVVVSPDFAGIPRRRRVLPVRKMWKFDYPADVLCYTPEEFERRTKSVSIVNEAFRTGVAI